MRFERELRDRSQYTPERSPATKDRFGSAVSIYQRLHRTERGGSGSTWMEKSSTGLGLKLRDGNGLSHLQRIEFTGAVMPSTIYCPAGSPAAEAIFTRRVDANRSTPLNSASAI